MSVASLRSAITSAVNNPARLISKNWVDDLLDHVEGLGPTVFTPEAYGATRNGTSDDTAAFVAMFAAMPNTGGVVVLSAGTYKITSRVTVPKCARIYGAGSGTRNYVYGETQTGEAWAGYTGTVILVAADTAGLFFPLHTDVETTSTVLANMGATGSNATYWEFPGATGSTVKDLVLFSLGGTSASAHGIEHRAVVHFENVDVLYFGGEGFLCSASADVDSVGSSYGNASYSTYRSCRAAFNRGDGFKAIGRDANILQYDSCDAQLNGGWGYNDASTYGAVYTNCHAATNNALSASYPTRGASANASVGSFRSIVSGGSTYINCYAETGNGEQYNVGLNSQIIGGVMSGNARESGSSIPRIVRGSVERGGALTTHNLNYHGGGFNLAADIGGTTTPRVLAWGTDENGEDIYSGNRNVEVYYFSGAKTYAWEPPGYFAGMWMNMPTLRTQIRRIAPAFPQGLFLGSHSASLGIAEGPHIGFTTAASPPNGTYANGDIILKSPAAAGGKIGWVCTTAGTKAAAWVTGTTYTYNSAPSLNAYIETGGNVYSLHTQGGGTSTVAPTHTSGTNAAGADGYRWTYLNASTSPVFKEWGAIDV